MQTSQQTQTNLAALKKKKKIIYHKQWDLPKKYKLNSEMKISQCNRPY